MSQGEGFVRDLSTAVRARETSTLTWQDVGHESQGDGSETK